MRGWQAGFRVFVVAVALCLLRSAAAEDTLIESEPNNDEKQAEPLRFGQTRSGVLSEPRDRDDYRFFLAAEEHVALTVSPPADGAVQFRLDWGGRVLADSRSRAEAGAPVVFEGLLPPGDYHVVLKASAPSEGAYRVRLEHLDPFVLPADLEPNNTWYEARPLPPTLSATGTLGDPGSLDPDWYRLPVPAATTEISISREGEVSLGLADEGGQVLSHDLRWDAQTQMYSGSVPAGIARLLRVEGSGPYRIAVQFADNSRPEPARAALPVELQVKLIRTEVAAYWHHGQRIEGEVEMENPTSSARTVMLEARSSDERWKPVLGQRSVDLGAGARVAVTLSVEVAPDARADEPVRISVLARGPGAEEKSASAELTARRDAEPSESQRTWSLPEALLGGLNAASLVLGAAVVTEDKAFAVRQANLHDGLTDPGEGFFCLGRDLPCTLTVRLAGETLVPVTGVILNPQSQGPVDQRLREFDVLLSSDGVSFQEVLSAELATLPIDQAFLLPSPVEARFAQLRLRSNREGNARAVYLGEWKVIARPGTSFFGVAGPNLAAPALGGHVVWAQPQLARFYAEMESLLTEKSESPKFLQKGTDNEWVIGFHHDRAPQISEMRWTDRPGSRPEQRLGRVEVSISRESPVGPWTALATWVLREGKDSETAPPPLLLDQPVWARYVRFMVREADADNVALPDTLWILERPTDETYQSILGEWGQDSREAIAERLEPAADRAAKSEEDGNDERAGAQSLPLELAVQGHVRIGRDVDWYRIQVPQGQNTLTLSVSGEPSIAVRLRLEEEQGTPVVLTSVSRSPEEQVLKAAVEPGGLYLLNVEEPPRSVVFCWDTSGSVTRYLPAIRAALARFVQDVAPGREAARLLPFGEPFLLDHWEDQPAALQAALANQPPKEGSGRPEASDAQAALLQASATLAEREGARAIVLLTDAASPGYSQTAELWKALSEVQPRVFAVTVSSGGAVADRFHRQHLMQSWASVNGGHYSAMRVMRDLDVAFDRAATWLRRPAGYRLAVVASNEAPPAPGRIEVVMAAVKPGSKPQTGARAGAIELILDASGSMLQRLEGRRRIEIAKDVLTDLATVKLPPGVPLALRVFGHTKEGSCDTELAVPLRPLDPGPVAQTIAGIQSKNLAKTPIAASLRLVGEDLAKAQGQKVVVLVTDGEETCGGDPEAEIRALREKGIDVRVNIVGFAVDDEALREQFRAWSELGGGQYFEAAGAAQLGSAVEQALRPAFEVLGADGHLVVSGVVDGGPLEVPAGTYTVRVLLEPPHLFESVVVSPGQRTRLDVPRSP